MNILILTPEYSGSGGGIMTYYRHLAPALVQAGCKVRVIEGSGFQAFDSPSPAVIDGVEVQRLENSRLTHWLGRFDHLRSAPVLRRALAAAWAVWEQAGDSPTPDIVETTDFGLLGIPAIASPRTPLVLQHHGSFGQIQLHDPDDQLAIEGALSLALEGAALGLAVAPQTLASSNASFWRRQTGRPVRCLRPAWRGLETASRPAVEDHIVVFGRIQNWKGPRVLCEALRSMPNTPPIIWHGRDIAVGGVSTDKALRTSYPDVWGRRVEPRPPVPPERVLALQASAKLNLVPSTWDVFNFTVIEAMHSGRPVICSSGAGASELIEHGKTGFLYDGTSPTELATTLSHALALPESALAAIGERARERVALLLNPEKIARDRVEEYRTAIALQNDRSVVTPEWVRQIATPRNAASGGLSFLDQQPIAALAGYLATRVLRRSGF